MYSIKQVQLLLAWAAGFFDGEGCISVSSQRLAGREPTYSLRVSVAQNCRHTLEQFRIAVGGIGAIYESQAANGGAGRVFHLVATGPNALALIRKLMPYLRRKRVEAITAIVFCAFTQPHLHPRRNGTANWVRQVRGSCAALIAMQKRSEALR